MSYDKSLVIEILQQINDSISLVKKRCSYAKIADDFLQNDEGLIKLDSICMRLIAIGEALKNIDKITGRKLLAQYPEIDWKSIKGIRDLLSHHYFDMDAEVIFGICKEHVEPLQNTISRMLDDLK
ncbi:HepT-like ribonuclease domain-containing protein [Hydrogenimonas sp. SS33]|uniref:HepT-like ribonuclease domain-containing protein n=1 Tax=Hydrogenimonas leucolamina TaxID=2954236 RepID=UPI00336BC4B5